MMKCYNVYLREKESQDFTLFAPVTAPSGIAAIQSQMVVQKFRYVHYGLALEADTDGQGESVNVMRYVYVPPTRLARKAVR